MLNNPFRFCVDPAGNDVEILPEGATEGMHSEETTGEENHEGHDHDSAASGSSTSATGMNCHFHAGVESVLSTLVHGHISDQFI